jgi:hypothetical protein
MEKKWELENDISFNKQFYFKGKLNYSFHCSDEYSLLIPLQHLKSRVCLLMREEMDEWMFLVACMHMP